VAKDLNLKRALPPCTVHQLLFDLHELQMPPVLSSHFYEPQPPSRDKLAVSCWFATRSSLLNVQMPTIYEDMCEKVSDVNGKPDGAQLKKCYAEASSTFAAPLQCCTSCKPQSNHLPAYCSLLQAYVDTLRGWVAPKELCHDQDLIKTASEFIENPQVISQFSLNFTLRQQWLAIALATLLKVCQLLFKCVNNSLKMEMNASYKKMEAFCQGHSAVFAKLLLKKISMSDDSSEVLSL
jgi:hypothetical protein